jgi:glycosyltransferase involved in cell wall biosynthesis
MSRLDWEITVVTPNPPFFSFVDDSRTIEDLYEAGIRRILSDHGWRILLQNYYNGPLGSFATRVSRRVAWQLGIDLSIGWLKAAEAACKSLASEDVDVILATGPPYVAFRLAQRLADRLGRPYVLDYRDLWTADPFVRRPRQAAIRQEKELLKGSAGVVANSRSSASSLDGRFDVGSRLHVVTNGYDPQELATVKPCDFQHFAVVYTGSLFSPMRLITPVMAALQRLQRLTDREACIWKFHYYGPDGTHVRQEAERFAVADRVMVHGTVPHTEALSAVRGAGVAVVINTTADSCTPNDKGVIPGKVFEALGLGTPILLISPPGSDAREIVNESCMAQSFTGSDIEGIARFLLRRMRTKSVKVGCSIDGQYSWPVLAQKLDKILKRIVEQRVPPAKPLAMIQ